MSRWNMAWLLGLPVAMLVGAALAFSAPAKTRDDYALVRVLVDVMAEVDQHYVRELTPDQRRKFVEDMINGGLEKLDPYSAYFNPDDLRGFKTQTDGNFAGVGVEIDIDSNLRLPKIAGVMPETPAYEAGLLANDYILEVDRTSAHKLTRKQVAGLIQGEPGTEVSFLVVHEGEEKPVRVAVERAKIDIKTVLGYRHVEGNPKEWEWFLPGASDVAYVRVAAFNDNTAGDLQKVVRRVAAAGAKGLVLDLRDNPGGLLSSAIDVSDLFLTSGKIVSTRDRHERGKTWEAKEDGTLFEPAAARPVAVLVNHNSASAAEIVAAALQDNGRAVVVGERTFGKGSVQKIIEMETEPRTALKLTTDTYWRPSGKNIHRYEDSKDSDDWGVRPNDKYDIKLKLDEVRQFYEDRRAPRLRAGQDRGPEGHGPEAAGRLPRPGARRGRRSRPEATGGRRLRHSSDTRHETRERSWDAAAGGERSASRRGISILRCKSSSKTTT